MRTWISTVCILFVAVVCHGKEGKEDILGPVDFAVDKAEKLSVKQYYDVNSGGQSILKIYENGTWEDARVSKDNAGNSVLQIRDGNGGWKTKEGVSLGNDTYVISHGLNSTHDSDWITKSAKAIASNEKTKNSIIISVNWDHYSGTGKGDPNFGSSSWINSVTPVLADSLKGFTNIKSFVGHSYGAHLLAATAVTMKDDLGNNISFIALDPAEETLTYTGDKDGKPTWMWSKDKKSKNWGLPDNLTSEVYKSSGFLGSEEKLGDYNYFLAAEETITPRGVLGDLDTGTKKFIENHSLAAEWFGSMMANGHFDGDKLGGWFNSDVDGKLTLESRKNRGHDDKEWDGVVNATASVKKGETPKLEYNATIDENKKNPVKTWQELCDAEARDRLEKGLKWEDSFCYPTRN